MERAQGYKSFDSTLPEPIAFYSWKHHLSFICNEIDRLRNTTTHEEIFFICQGIGGSILDLYTGYLMPNVIAHEVIENLLQKDVLTPLKYNLWIDSSCNDYRQINLSDESSWTLRKGKYPNKYVHVHPSRYSKNTIRVKPSTLKTAIAMMILYPQQYSQPTIEQLNYARKSFPNLSPVKGIKSVSSTIRLLKYLNS
jgi:hypothetical protein